MVNAIRTDMENRFVPLLLGADINVYSMARAFHEAYGVKTVAYGMYPSGVCVGSDIIDYRVCENNDAPEVVLANVKKVAAEFSDRKVIVLGCAGMAGYADVVRSDLGMEVIDPSSLALKVTEALVAAGVKQSKRGYYSYPPCMCR